MHGATKNIKKLGTEERSKVKKKRREPSAKANYITTRGKNKQKKIVSERRKLYRVNKTTAAPVVLLPMPPVAEELPRAVQRIAETLHPEKIILFGSYAYGKPTRDSDVDLLVIWDTSAPRKERHWAVAQLMIPRVFPLDLLVRTPVEIKSGLKKGDFFLQEIITQGKVLYERSN